MEAVIPRRPTGRYRVVDEEKASGATYTPRILADFVADQMIRNAGELPAGRRIRVLDPAVGRGGLLVSLLEKLAGCSRLDVEARGFDTNPDALDAAAKRIRAGFPEADVRFENGSFLERAAANAGTGDLFRSVEHQPCDLVIANPPYVRAQVMGAARSRLLAETFDLSGRVDLYHAFVLGMSQALEVGGTAGIIVSNRFMTTKAGAAVRRALLRRFDIRHVWDLGDTKLFDAAVLPAVLLAGRRRDAGTARAPGFTSIYETSRPARHRASDQIAALSREGVVEIDDRRRFSVRHGALDTSGSPDGVWRMATAAVDAWLSTVEARSWGRFGDIGKIRVGVKTCADRAFIRNDWSDMPVADRPELLRPLTTHHVARRFRPVVPERRSEILYPHETSGGRRRPVDLSRHPRSLAYLERHRPGLEARRYLAKAGREWYEIWVPQDPDAWRLPKLVFRDISEQPTFRIDLEGSVVNGDCYWLACRESCDSDLLWLAAAVGNSTFIEQFYDHRFNNKLYAGRRRFMTQYVEEFPIPDPGCRRSKEIVSMARKTYEATPSAEADALQKEVDDMVWESFGLASEEAGGQATP